MLRHGYVSLFPLPFFLKKGFLKTVLPKEQRLRKNRDFRHIYSRGRSFANSLAVIYISRRTGDSVAVASSRRIGFVVSKKQGGAVVRNRIKRHLQEAIRLNLAHISEEPIDIIFVARSALKNAEWTEILSAIEELLRRAKLWQET